MSFYPTCLQIFELKIQIEKHITILIPICTSHMTNREITIEQNKPPLKTQSIQLILHIQS